MSTTTNSFSGKKKILMPTVKRQKCGRITAEQSRINMTMIFLNILLGFLTGAGLLVFVVLYPGIIGKRSEILFQKQEVVAAVGIVVSALCVVLLWLLHSTSFGTLFAQVFIN